VIAGLGPYEEYKESGLPWLGQMPGHWQTRRLRHACDLRVSNVDKHTKPGENPVRLCNYVEVYKNERIRESTRFMAASASEGERMQFRLRKGDVLITKDSETWNDIGVPSLVEFEASDLVCGYHLAILRPRSGLHGAYLHRAIECHFIAAQFHVEANGVTRYGLSHGAIRGVTVPLPPPAEQEAIVRFLDWANGRLERAIRAKRKVIALLNEQKQAIIHRAVTRGLDPSVPLKPSGVPWLGEVPSHWEVRRVKQATRILRGKFSHRPRNDASLYDGPYPFIQTGVVAQSSKFIKSYSQTLNEKGLAVSKLFPSGTLVMTIAANIGEVAVLTFDACFPDSIVGFVPSASADRDYLYMVFLCMKPDLLREAPVNTQGNLNVERIGAIGMPFPPLGEQCEIARRAEAETAAFEIGMRRLNREIDLLREYRTRLVADVVTGKLDVREAATRLPEEAPPDTAVDDTGQSIEAEAADEETAA
jgi:type I restriction enzyme, S subunit